MIKIKDDKGHFTTVSKVIAMIAGAVTLLIAVGGAAFQIDERHTSTMESDQHLQLMTIEVAGQFKAIDDSRKLSDLQNALALTQIRLDILEDRLFREQQKSTPSAEYIQKLEGDLRQLNRQFDQINEQLLEM